MTTPSHYSRSFKLAVAGILAGVALMTLAVLTATSFATLNVVALAGAIIEVISLNRIFAALSKRKWADVREVNSQSK